jgi:hypothetical protein
MVQWNNVVIVVSKKHEHECMLSQSKVTKCSRIFNFLSTLIYAWKNYCNYQSLGLCFKISDKFGCHKLFLVWKV